MAFSIWSAEPSRRKYICTSKSKAGTGSWILTFSSVRPPSLVCDFQELYRYLVDEFAVVYCRELDEKDFIVKRFLNETEGQREYLNDSQTQDFVKALNQYFQSKVEIPGIRMGDQQEIETLINEEASLLAMLLRSERQSWKPRISELD